MAKDNSAAKQLADLRNGAKGIKEAVRRQDWQAAVALIKVFAPNAAKAGHPELIEAWVQSIPVEFVQGSAELSYWSGINIALERPWEARPHLQRAFDLLRDGPCGNEVLLAWAGLLDAIFAQCRDLRELDPLFDWMTLEREGIVDRMPPPLRSLVVGSALFAFAFRQPHHPRMGTWRDRAQKLFERDPVSDLGARLIAGLMTDYLWRGNIAEAEVLWSQFRARAARVRLTPLTDVSRYLSESTLLLHQGRLEECQSVVSKGLQASSRHGVRVWDGVMRCQAATAALSREALDEANQHLAAIEQLFADGVQIDEAFYRATLFWRDFVAGDHVGGPSRCEQAVELTDTRGVPYLRAVCRIGAALTLFEADRRERGAEMLAEALHIGLEIGNPVVAWIGGLFQAHMYYANGHMVLGDSALAEALSIGREHSLVHFFFWPRRIITRLVTRALERGLYPDYLARLIETHQFAPGKAPARSDRWPFAVRIYTLGRPRVVHADGKDAPLSSQFRRQIELLASLIGRQGKPTPVLRVAEDVYFGEQVDPASSLMRVLHSFRERVGPVVVRRQGALEFDFSKVWIDACSFQQLHQETRNAHEIEAWLDRNYAGHFMEGLDDSVIVTAVRRRLAGHAAHAIGDAKDIAARAGDLQTLRRLEERWQALFPTVFSTQVA